MPQPSQNQCLLLKKNNQSHLPNQVSTLDFHYLSNATDICLALDELGLEGLDYEERDFYYMIHAEPACIHPHLLRCLKDNGNQVLKLDSEDEIDCFSSAEGIDFEKVEA